MFTFERNPYFDPEREGAGLSRAIGAITSEAERRRQERNKIAAEGGVRSTPRPQGGLRGIADLLMRKVGLADPRQGGSGLVPTYRSGKDNLPQIGQIFGGADPTAGGGLFKRRPAFGVPTPWNPDATMPGGLTPETAAAAPPVAFGRGEGVFSRTVEPIRPPGPENQLAKQMNDRGLFTPTGGAGVGQIGSDERDGVVGTGPQMKRRPFQYEAAGGQLYDMPAEAFREQQSRNSGMDAEEWSRRQQETQRARDQAREDEQRFKAEQAAAAYERDRLEEELRQKNRLEAIRARPVGGSRRTGSGATKATTSAQSAADRAELSRLQQLAAVTRAQRPKVADESLLSTTQREEYQRALAKNNAELDEIKRRIDAIGKAPTTKKAPTGMAGMRTERY